MKHLWLLLFCCISLSAVAQNGGILLQILPANSIVRLNGVEYKNLTYVEVPFGVYSIEAWAPGRKYAKDTIEIFTSAIVKYDTILPITDEYKVYSKEFTEYSKIKTNNGILKGSIVLFNAGITAVVMGFMPGDVKQHRDAANDALEVYNNSTGLDALAESRRRYETETQLYEEGKEKRKKYLYIALPSLVAVYGISVFTWTRLKKGPPKPVLNAPNPFATMDLRLAPEFGDGYTPRGMGFRFSMKF
jgi:hypothetical protein